MADAPLLAKRPISAAVAARRERARLRALPLPSSSAKRAREAEPLPPAAKAAPPPPPEGAPREPSAAELDAYSAAEAGRAAVRAAQKRAAATQELIGSAPGGHTRASEARLAALRARLAPERAQLLAATAAAARSEAAAVAFGGGGAEAAYTRRGERFLDIVPLVAACGYADEASQCRALCGLTWRPGDLGATNDMIVSSLRLQCGAVRARAARREDFAFARHDLGIDDLSFDTVLGTTQLIRATITNNLPRVLQLIQLGAPLTLANEEWAWSALHWASHMGHEHVAAALLEGKYKGVDIDELFAHSTALTIAGCHAGVTRMLLARGAKQIVPGQRWTAMNEAVRSDSRDVLELLLAAPDASDALKAETDHRTPLNLAMELGHAEIEALLRAAGAPE